MLFTIWLTLACSVFAARGKSHRKRQSTTYVLDTNMSGNTFFNNFNFFSGGDPTHGFVTYSDATTSYNTGRAYYAQVNGQVVPIMTADYTNTYNGNAAYVDSNGNPINGVGRPSVRITSIKSWTQGLFIGDIFHMPSTVRSGSQGCGTWPAFWTLGTANWPSGGEIDILEGVNNQVGASSFAHTGNTCTTTESGISNANVLGTDCEVYYSNGQYSNTAGCGAQNTNANSFGASFNSNGGGVFAMQWTSSFIKVWFFPRNAIPSNIASGNPDPTSGWGNPSNIISGNCNIGQNFQNHQIVFDLTFCGDWAGAVFANQCPGLGSCSTYVGNNPKDFEEAWWGINSVKVYTAGASSSTTSTKSSTTSTKSTTSTSTTKSSTTTTKSTTSTTKSTTSTTKSTTTSSKTTTKASTTAAKKARSFRPRAVRQDLHAQPVRRSGPPMPLATGAVSAENTDSSSSVSSSPSWSSLRDRVLNSVMRFF